MLNNKIPDNEIANLFNEMCYEILVKHTKGATYVRLIEQMLMMPVVMLGKDLCWSQANEGRNEFLRSMFNGAYKCMNAKPKDNKIKKVTRSKKDPLKNE